MGQITPTVKKILLAIGIIVLLEAIIIFVLIFTERSNLSLIVPIPLTICGILMTLLGLRK